MSPPALGAGTRVFTPREFLASTRKTVTLKDATAAVALRFALPIVVATGGTSYVQATYFRPYAQFADAGAIFRNYDLVESDYFVGARTTFDRSGDVLR